MPRKCLDLLHSSLVAVAEKHIAAGGDTAETHIVAEGDGIAAEVAPVELGDHDNSDTSWEVENNYMAGCWDAVDVLSDEASGFDAANLCAPRLMLKLHKVESVAVGDMMLKSQRKLKGMWRNV